MTNDTKLILNVLKDLQTQLTLKFLEYDQKFDSIDKKFDAIDKKFDSIDQKFISSDARFDSIQNQLNSLENIVTKIEIEHGNKIQLLLEQTCSLIEQQKEIKESINEINSKLDNHEMRIQILEEKIL